MGNNSVSKNLKKLSANLKRNVNYLIAIQTYDPDHSLATEWQSDDRDDKRGAFSTKIKSTHPC